MCYLSFFSRGLSQEKKKYSRPCILMQFSSRNIIFFPRIHLPTIKSISPLPHPPTPQALSLPLRLILLWRGIWSSAPWCELQVGERRANPLVIKVFSRMMSGREILWRQQMAKRKNSWRNTRGKYEDNGEICRVDILTFYELRLWVK